MPGSSQLRRRRAEVARAGRARTLVLGVLNVTPDSFSDGGRFLDEDAAVRRGVELAEQGADVIDVGGESTRPGAARVPVDQEQRRVLPVVEALARQRLTVSIDTMNASTALQAVQAGAGIVNDVSGGLVDPEMASVIARTGVTFVVSHWRAPSDAMQEHAVYEDVVADVRRELKDRVAALLVEGVDPSRIVLDPGLGFSKTGAHNWRLLAHLERLTSLGFPVLIGASRKRFLGELTASGAHSALVRTSADDPRDFASAVVSALAAEHGVWGVRVHDVPSTRAALTVAEAWRAALA